MPTLEELFVKYGTDKGVWGYTPAYENALAWRRASVLSVLEIGICGERDIPNNVTGASLFAWQDYFPNARIYGVDNDRRWHVETDRIQSFIGDAYSPSFIRRVGESVGSFDFICDDAVHDPEPQLKLFYMLSGHLKPGGLYAIEDYGPYKLPVQEFIKRLPRSYRVQVVHTHKPEKLLLLQR